MKTVMIISSLPLSPVISPFLKEKGITMSNDLKPLPLTLLLFGSYLSDVTWGGQTDALQTRLTCYSFPSAYVQVCFRNMLLRRSQPCTQPFPSWEMKCKGERG